MDFPSYEDPSMTIRSFPYSIISCHASGIGSSGPIERLSKDARFSERDNYMKTSLYFWLGAIL